MVKPQKTWTAKLERQYVHIKEGLLDQGKSQPPTARCEGALHDE